MGHFLSQLGPIPVLLSLSVFCGQTAPRITQYTTWGQQILVRAWIKETFKSPLKVPALAGLISASKKPQLLLNVKWV